MPRYAAPRKRSAFKPAPKTRGVASLPRRTEDVGASTVKKRPVSGVPGKTRRLAASGTEKP